MKTKLTLTVDDQLIRRAKAIAQDENTSLSSLVETFFANLSRRSRQSFSEKWRGGFKEAPRIGAGRGGLRSPITANALRR